MGTLKLPLVVGVDGSESGLEAVDWAVAEAARHEVPLHLLHAYLWERYEGTLPGRAADHGSARLRAEHIVAGAAERARRGNPGIEVTTEVVAQEPAAALLMAGRNAFALVTGHRGRGELAGALLGSVGLTVAARAHCPVVVVRGARPAAPDAFRRVAFGVGDAKDGSAAAEFAFREAEVRHSALHAVRAWRCPAFDLPDMPVLQGRVPEPHLRAAEEKLYEALRASSDSHPRVAVRRDPFEGSAREALLTAAADADLLVVGARHRNGPFGMQLGPANQAVLHHAPCPVVVVPEPA
ncbi:universal stress protein [Streptomyces sp. NBC_01476]|uniref:universal stress protein n=1 Tax=Streptomyces sp. NBC_01476 TaxID=2903881 RepID=UPI002E362CF8|nr:universal stress protein [Streptomyces sp. NBC_01476]